MSAVKNKRILIFNVNWVGDVLFSTPVIRNIRYNFPESFIACVVPSRCYQVLKGNPYLDEVIIFDEKDRHRHVFDKMKFVRDLKAKKFDTVFLLHRSLTRALICRLAGIKERIGYNTKRRAFLLTKKIVPPARDSLHRIDYYLWVIEKAGLKVEDRYLDFFVSEEDKSAVGDFLKRNSVTDGDLLAGINPGGNWLPKRWPPEYWAALCDRLIVELGAKVVITGSSSDIGLVRGIRAMMKEAPIVACGVFNLKQLGAFAVRSKVFITADTGPLHIAKASGAGQVIALFGPTSKDITGPYPAKGVAVIEKDVGCKIPCYNVKCLDNRCMKAISVDEVFRAVASFLTPTH